MWKPTTWIPNILCKHCVTQLLNVELYSPRNAKQNSKKASMLRRRRKKYGDTGETQQRVKCKPNQLPNGRLGTLKQHQIYKEPPKMVEAVGNAYGSSCINSGDEWVGNVLRKNEPWLVSPGLFTYLHPWLGWRVQKQTRGMMSSKDHGKRFDFTSYTNHALCPVQVFSGNMKFEW